MAIKFYSEKISFTLKNKIILRTWIQKTIAKEKKETGDINFIFCSDSFLLQINKKYLKHDSLTDIITFDYTMNELCGDIYISIERVKYNANKFSIPFETEVHRVMIHGILHLIGYNDKSKKDKKEMTAKENNYLKKLPSNLQISTTFNGE